MKSIVSFLKTLHICSIGNNCFKKIFTGVEIRHLLLFLFYRALHREERHQLITSLPYNGGYKIRNKTENFHHHIPVGSRVNVKLHWLQIKKWHTFLVWSDRTLNGYLIEIQWSDARGNTAQTGWQHLCCLHPTLPTIQFLRIQPSLRSEIQVWR